MNSEKSSRFPGFSVFIGNDETYVRFETQSIVSNEPCCNYGDLPLNSEDPLFTKLHKWAYLGDLNKIKKFLAKGNINAEDGEGRTSLHLCAYGGNPEAVSFLLNSGANPEAEDKDGRTPFLRAVEKGNIRNVQILLQFKVNVEAKDHYENTALHLATQSRSKDLLELLLEVGLRPDVANIKGEAPLHIAATNLDTDLVSCLIANGANPNCSDKEGVTPLMMAAKQGCKPLIDTLLRSGSDASQVDCSGWSASSYARYCGYIELHDWIEGRVKKDSKPSTSGGMLGLGLTFRDSNDENDKKMEVASADDEYSLKSWSEDSTEDSLKESRPMNFKISQFLSTSKDSLSDISAHSRISYASSSHLSGPPKPPRLHSSTSKLENETSSLNLSPKDNDPMSKKPETDDSWNSTKNSERSEFVEEKSKKEESQLRNSNSEERDNLRTQSEISFGDDDSNMLPSDHEGKSHTRKLSNFSDLPVLENLNSDCKNKSAVKETFSFSLEEDDLKVEISNTNDDTNLGALDEDLTTTLIKTTIHGLEKEKPSNSESDAVPFKKNSKDVGATKDSDTKSISFNSSDSFSKASDNADEIKLKDFDNEKVCEPNLEFSCSDTEESPSKELRENKTSLHEGTLGRIDTLQQVEEMWEANASLSQREDISESSSNSSEPRSSERLENGISDIKMLFFGESRENINKIHAGSLSQKREPTINKISDSESNLAISTPEESSRSLPLPSPSIKNSFELSNSLSKEETLSKELLSLNKSPCSSPKSVDSDSTINFEEYRMQDINLLDLGEVQNVISCLKILLNRYEKRKHIKSRDIQSKDVDNKSKDKLEDKEQSLSDKESEICESYSENRKLEYFLSMTKSDLSHSSRVLQKIEKVLKFIHQENENLRENLVDKGHAIKTCQRDITVIEDMIQALKAQTSSTLDTPEREGVSASANEMPILSMNPDAKSLPQELSTEAVSVGKEDIGIQVSLTTNEGNIPISVPTVLTADGTVQTDETGKTCVHSEASGQLYSLKMLHAATSTENLLFAEKYAQTEETENNDLESSKINLLEDIRKAEAWTSTMNIESSESFIQTDAIETASVQTQFEKNLAVPKTLEVATCTMEILATSDHTQTEEITKRNVEAQIEDLVTRIKTKEVSTSTVNLPFNEKFTQTEAIEKASALTQFEKILAEPKTLEAATCMEITPANNSQTQTEAAEMVSVETQNDIQSYTSQKEMSTSTINIPYNENFTQTAETEKTSVQTQFEQNLVTTTCNEKSLVADNHTQTEHTKQISVQLQTELVADTKLRDASTSTINNSSKDFTHTKETGKTSIQTQFEKNLAEPITSDISTITMELSLSSKYTQTEPTKIQSLETQKSKSGEKFTQTEEIKKLSVETQIGKLLDVSKTESSTCTTEVLCTDNITQTEEPRNNSIGVETERIFSESKKDSSTSTEILLLDECFTQTEEIKKISIKTQYEKKFDDIETLEASTCTMKILVNDSLTQTEGIKKHSVETQSEKTSNNKYMKEVSTSPMKSGPSENEHKSVQTSEASTNTMKISVTNNQTHTEKISTKFAQTQTENENQNQSRVEESTNSAECRQQNIIMEGENEYVVKKEFVNKCSQTEDLFFPAENYFELKQYYSDLLKQFQDLNNNLKSILLDGEIEERLKRVVISNNESNFKASEENLKKDVMSMKELLSMNIKQVNDNILNKSEIQKLCEEIQHIQKNVQNTVEMSSHMNSVMSSNNEISQTVEEMTKLLKNNSDILSHVYGNIKGIHPQILNSLSDDLKTLKLDSSRFCTKNDLEELKFGSVLERLKHLSESLQDSDMNIYLRENLDKILNKATKHEKQLSEMAQNENTLGNESLSDIKSMIEQLTSQYDELAQQNSKVSLCNLDTTVRQNFETLQNLMTDLKNEMANRVKELESRTDPINQNSNIGFENLSTKLEDIYDSLKSLKLYVESVNLESFIKSIDFTTNEPIKSNNDHALTILQSQGKLILDSLEKCIENLMYIKDNEYTLKEEIRKINLDSEKYFINHKEELEICKRDLEIQNSNMKKDLDLEKKQHKVESEKRNELEKEIYLLMKNNQVLKEEIVSLKITNERLKHRYEDLSSRVHEQNKINAAVTVKESYRLPETGNYTRELALKESVNEELLSTLKYDLELEKEKNKVHEEEKSKLKDEIIKDKNDFIGQIKQLKSKISFKEERIKILEKQILEKELSVDEESLPGLEYEFLNEIKTLKDKKKALENDVKAKGKIIKEIKEKNYELENEYKEIEIDLNAKATEASDYKNEIGIQKNKIKTLMKQIEERTENEKSLYALQQKIQELESDAAHKQNLILNLKERVSSFSQEKVQLVKEISLSKENELSLSIVKRQRDEMEESLILIKRDYESLKENLEKNYIPRSKLNAFYQEIEEYLQDTYLKKLASHSAPSEEKVSSLEKMNRLLKDREHSLKMIIKDLEDQIKDLNTKISVVGYNAQLWKSKYQNLFESHYKVPVTNANQNYQHTKGFLKEDQEIPQKDSYQDNVIREINDLLERPYEDSALVSSAIGHSENKTTSVNNPSKSSIVSLPFTLSPKSAKGSRQYDIDLISANLKTHIPNERDTGAFGLTPRPTKDETVTSGKNKYFSFLSKQDPFDEYSNFLKKY